MGYEVGVSKVSDMKPPGAKTLLEALFILSSNENFLTLTETD